MPKWLAVDTFKHDCAISLEVGELEQRASSFQANRNLLADGRQTWVELYG